MNTKFFSVLAAAAVALVVSVSSSYAVAYTPAQFTAELKKKVGTKKGAAAATAAASFFKIALSDKANKKNATLYATSVVSTLGKALAPNDRPKALNSLVTSLLNGYFTGLKFSLKDAGYNNALVKLSTLLLANQRTVATSQTIYNTIKAYAKPRGVTQDQVYTYYKGVETKLKLPTPVS